MKNLSVVFLILVVAVGSAFAKGPKVFSHGKQVAGQIKSVDEAAKSMVVVQGGKDLTIYWTDATKVTGGTVAVGERATIRSMQKDGKWIATSVKITAAAKPAATKKPS